MPGGASGTAVRLRAGTTGLMRSFFSTHGRNGSYRRPRVRSAEDAAASSSWKKAECQIGGDVSIAYTPKLSVDVVVRSPA